MHIHPLRSCGSPHYCNKMPQNPFQWNFNEGLIFYCLLFFFSLLVQQILALVKRIRWKSPAHFFLSSFVAPPFISPQPALACCYCYTERRTTQREVRRML